jgi:predicted metalloprotease
MRWKGRRQSTNVEDVRSTKRSAAGLKGGLIGTLVVAAIIYFLGGDPLQVINLGNLDPDSGEKTELTREEIEMGEFVSVVLADIEDVGHHAQNLLGIMDDFARYKASGAGEKEINHMTVKLELQADFLAGVWVHHGQKMHSFLEEGDLQEALNAASAVGDDRIQMKSRGYVTPDSFQHGTASQRKNWLYKGVKTGDIRQGDTFSVTRL